MTSLRRSECGVFVFFIIICFCFKLLLNYIGGNNPKLTNESRGFTIKFEILIRSSQGLTASGTDPGRWGWRGGALDIKSGRGA